MPWNNQSGGSGGPWGSGNGGGPWGQGPRGSGGPQGSPPDLEDIIRRGQDRLKRALPGGAGANPAFLGLVALVVVVAERGVARRRVHTEAVAAGRRPLVTRLGRWKVPAAVLSPSASQL